MRFTTPLPSCRLTGRLCWLQCNGMEVRSLEYASAELRADHEVVLAAVRRDGGFAIRHASAELKADPKVVLAAVLRKDHRSGPDINICVSRTLVSIFFLVIFFDDIASTDGVSLPSSS